MFRKCAKGQTPSAVITEWNLTFASNIECLRTFIMADTEQAKQGRYQRIKKRLTDRTPFRQHTATWQSGFMTSDPLFHVSTRVQYPPSKSTRLQILTAVPIYNPTIKFTAYFSDLRSEHSPVAIPEGFRRFYYSIFAKGSPSTDRETLRACEPRRVITASVILLYQIISDLNHILKIPCFLISSF